MSHENLTDASKRVSFAFRRILLGVGGIMLVTAVGFGIVGLAGDGPVGLDRRWREFFAGHRSPFADALALALNSIGGTVVMSVVTGVVVLLMMARRRWTSAIAIALAVALSTVASELLKSATDRPRPSGALLSLGSSSYPSGHSTAAAAFALALFYAYPRVWTRVFAAVWIPLMAWSRTYLSVHWLSDVAAGALLGISVAVLVFGVCAVSRRGDTDVLALA